VRITLRKLKFLELSCLQRPILALKGKDLNKIALLKKLLRKLSDFCLSDIKNNIE